MNCESRDGDQYASVNSEKEVRLQQVFTRIMTSTRSIWFGFANDHHRHIIKTGRVSGAKKKLIEFKLNINAELIK